MPPKNRVGSLLSQGTSDRKNKSKANNRKEKQDDFIVSDDISESQHVLKRRLKKQRSQHSEEQEFIPERVRSNDQSEDSSGTEVINNEKSEQDEEQALKRVLELSKKQRSGVPVKEEKKPPKGSPPNKHKDNKDKNPSSNQNNQLKIDAMFKNSKPQERTPNKKALEINGGYDQQALLQKAIKESMKTMGSAEKYENLNEYTFDKPNDGKKKKLRIASSDCEDEDHRRNQPIGSKHQKPSLIQEKPKPKQKSKRTKSDMKESKSKMQVENIVGPFTGKNFVLTGEFEFYNKMDLIKVLESLGAKCPKSLVKKTDYLIQGSYASDFRGIKIANSAVNTSKSIQAAKRNIQIIANEDIEAFFLEKTGKTLSDHLNKGNSKVQSNLTDFRLLKQDNKEMDNQLWTDKYRPRTTDDIIGQGAQIKNIIQWLKRWEDVHFRGNKIESKDNKNYGNAGTINSKATLITGEPGIGKTTAVRLLAAEQHYELVEFNASDVRNKSGVGRIERGSLTLDKAHYVHRTILLMDEVDGMSSGDRGGVAAIIEMIKKSKIPVICICNDRQSEKIRSLATHCYDLRFHRPDRRTIVKRLQTIVENEGGKAAEKALERVVELFQNDIRQIMTYLQTVMRTVTTNITLDVVNGSAEAKDSSVMLNHMQGARILLNALQFRKLTLQQRLNTFFIDHSLIPLLIHENYLSSVSSTHRHKTDAKQFHRIVQANQSFVLADILDKKIRKNQDYKLMPSYGLTCCIYPTEKVSQSMGFPAFPAWLGKNSSQRKNTRLIKELKWCLSSHISGGTIAVKQQYSVALLQMLAIYLKKEDINSAVEFLESYRLTPEMINVHLVSLQLHHDNPLSDVPSTVKGKLTRMFNKRHEEMKLKEKGKKTKEKIEHLKFDPILEDMENLAIDDEDDIKI